MSDKFTGIKEQIYGKVTGKPDLVETGQLRQTGELKRREHAEQVCIWHPIKLQQTS